MTGGNAIDQRVRRRDPQDDSIGKQDPQRVQGGSRTTWIDLECVYGSGEMIYPLYYGGYPFFFWLCTEDIDA